MKKLCVGIAFIFIGLSLYALEHENMSPNVNTTGHASITIENKSGEDFILYGDFTPKVYLLKKGAHIQVKFNDDMHKKGPVPMLVRPNDLILYSQDPDMVEKVVHAPTPNVQRLGNVLARHVKSHVYLVPEAASGLRRGLYTAVAGDRITLEPGDIAQAIGKTNFSHKLRLKKVNG